VSNESNLFATQNNSSNVNAWTMKEPQKSKQKRYEIKREKKKDYNSP